jgi:sec-independent protein translocase protein TatB
MTLMHPVAVLGGSLGAAERIVVFLAVLLLFGSKNLPRIARSIGRALEELRRAARDFSGEITRADLLSGESEVRKDAEKKEEPGGRAG